MSDQAPVWITGVGVLTSLGNSVHEVGEGLLAGRSGIGPVRGFDVSQHPSRIAGQIDSIPCPAGQCVTDFQRLDRLEQAVRWCCAEALRDAGVNGGDEGFRLGIVLGLSGEWMRRWETDVLTDGRLTGDPGQDTTPMVERVRAWLGASGPATSLSAACASGNYALALARSWLRRGWVDVCLAGACDLVITPMALAGFGNLRALSSRNDDPVRASRPFDRGRDGFVMAEGGAIFVLERAERARHRGARAYGALAGFGSTSDAHHMIIPSPDPAPAAKAVRRAIADAGIAPDQLHYVNAHATSTPVGDVSESKSLALALGDAVQHVPVSSTKSMTGHLLTAAAAIEALACLVAFARGAIPPTINLEDPDPECPLCHVPRTARESRVEVALSNSFGFGGSNTALVLTKV